MNAPVTDRYLAKVLLSALALFSDSVAAQEAQIRKNLAERMPALTKIDQVSKTPFAGVFELRVGKDLFYTDAGGNYLMQGTLFDTKARSNLTQARLDEINTVDFAALPLKDALVWKQGTGARKLAIFTDPNCGYCKRLERELRLVKDVTLYTFLIPVLGPDSVQKSRNIWCSKDAAKVWLDWMLENKPAATAAPGCDASALDRNLALAEQNDISATPVTVLENGRKHLGSLAVAELEHLVAGPKR